MTPLHVAAKRGVNSDIMKYLVDNKADINIKDNYGVSMWCPTTSTCTINMRVSFIPVKLSTHDLVNVLIVCIKTVCVVPKQNNSK